jgi:hypothetical protein
MFTKSLVPQSLVDAVSKIINENQQDMSEEEEFKPKKRMILEPEKMTKEEESGLRMAAHAANRDGKKTFEFQGKTYPVNVKEEEADCVTPMGAKKIAKKEVGKHEKTMHQNEERHMSDDEMKEREHLVKSMKKNLAGFKARYGERAKNVMYATATKRAMGEEAEQLDELGGISTISDEAVDDAATTTDTLAGRKKGGSLNQHGPDRKIKLKSEDNTFESKRPSDEVPFVTNEEEKESTSWKKDSGWKAKKPDVITDKSGAKHTPMSRAKDLARKSFNKIRQETMMGTAGATSEEKSK